MPAWISKDQGRQLLQMARKSIAEKLGLGGGDPAAPLERESELFHEKRGLFVTLHKQGRLRGCIGNIEPVKPLKQGVCENAVHAAFSDSRFPCLTADEFNEIDIEISILSLPRPLAYQGPEDLVARLIPHEHGVVLKKGGCKATFLPQVWDQLPRADEFLTQLCIKAGLLPNAWETEPLEISIYTVQSLEEPGLPRT